MTILFWPGYPSPTSWTKGKEFRRGFRAKASLYTLVEKLARTVKIFSFIVDCGHGLGSLYTDGPTPKRGMLLFGRSWSARRVGFTRCTRPKDILNILHEND